MNADYTIDAVFLHDGNRVMNLFLLAVGDEYQVAKETGLRGGWIKPKTLHRGPSLRQAKEVFSTHEQRAKQQNYKQVGLRSRVEEQTKLEKLRQQAKESDEIERLKRGELKFKWLNDGLTRHFDV